MHVKPGLYIKIFIEAEDGQSGRTKFWDKRLISHYPVFAILPFSGAGKIRP